MSQDINKAKDYKERHRFWQEKTLEQFGYANNLLIAINIAVIGFLVQQAHTEELKINICHWEWPATLLSLSIVMAFLSIVFGIMTVLSRLYDLRLTRHMIDIRKKDYTDFNKIIYTYYNERKNCIKIKSECYSLIKNFVKTILGNRKIYWIEDLYQLNFNIRQIFCIFILWEDIEILLLKRL